MANENATILLYLAVLLIYSDTDLLAPNLSDCAASFHFSELEKDEKLGGGLSMGVFLVGAPAAFSLGCLADGFVSRTKLLIIILVIGGTGCLLSAVAPNYECLFAARSLTGVSIAGAMPLSYALATGWHRPSQRLIVSSQLGVCSSIGVMGGQFISGTLGSRYGWRIPFVVVGSTILAGAVVLWRYLPQSTTLQSARRRMRQKQTLSLSQWSSLLRCKSYWLLLLQGIPGCVPWSVFGTFLPDYLHVNVGYTVAEATLIIVIFNFGVLLGTLVTGHIGQWLYNRSSKYPSLLMVAAGLLRIPLVCHLFDVPQTLGASCRLALVAGFLSAPTGALVRPTLSNVVLPNQLGVAFASFVLTDDLGRGGGPFVVSKLGSERHQAFTRAMYCWVPNALLGGMTYFTVVRDEANVKRCILNEKEEQGDNVSVIL